MASRRTMNAVRLAMRFANSTYDNEIETVIAACKKDLKNAGVEKISENDPLILRAFILYCRANIGFGDYSEKYQRAYDSFKLSLRESGDYRG